MRNEDLQDLVSKALRRAWQLGQKQAEVTQARFDELIEETRDALSATPAAAAPVELPPPDLWRDTEGLRGYKADPGAGPWYTADTVRALLDGVSAPADKLRVDALLHFMQANCFNNELNADESRNILFNIDQLREWRSGKHDDYVEKLYGRLHSMGGCEQGQGASAGRSGDASASAGDGLAVAAPQAQADARDAERYRFIVSKKLILSGGTEKFGWPIAPFGGECDRYIDAALAEAKETTE